jgi:hypothetical protein
MESDGRATAGTPARTRDAAASYPSVRSGELIKARAGTWQTSRVSRAVVLAGGGPASSPPPAHGDHSSEGGGRVRAQPAAALMRAGSGSELSIQWRHRARPGVAR